MANPIVHWELTGPDAKGLQDFYSKLFGWEVQNWAVGAENTMDYAVMNTGSVNGGIYKADGPGITMYIAVDNLQAYLDQIEAMGGKTVTPPSLIPNVGSFALFRDPAGNVIGLFKGPAQ